MTTRARDVRVLVKEMGAERGTVRALEQIAEELHDLKKMFMDSVELQGQIVDNMDRLTEVGNGMKMRLEEMKRKQQQGIDVQSEATEH